MLTVARTPLSLVTNTHYAMRGRDANDGRGRQTRSKRDVDKENNTSELAEEVPLRSKNAKTASSSSRFDKAFASKKANGAALLDDSPPRDKASAKRKAAAYDEDDDGFTFTRAKPKKPKTDGPVSRPRFTAKAPEPDPEPEPIEEEPQDEVRPAPKATTRTAGRPGRRGQKRNLETDEAPIVTNNHEPEPEPEHELEAEPEPAAKPTKRKGRPPKAQKTQKAPKIQKTENLQTQTSPSADADVPPLHVEKKRGRRGRSPPAPEEERQAVSHPETRPERARTPLAAGTTKIALPFADTPIIRKNQEMRRRASAAPGPSGERNGRGSRRSSLGQRGRRASSLIDSGRSSAMPHDAVDGSEFFKHIETALPEPRRMKQLLTWCATRALGDAKNKDKERENSKSKRRNAAADRENQVNLAAREIQNQILKDFGVRSDMSDWFGRPEEVETGRETVLKRPNPRNEANEKKIKELETQLARLQAERTTWESLLQPSSDKPLLAPLPLPNMSTSTKNAGTTDISASPSFANIDATLLSASNAAILASLRGLNVRTAPVLQEQTRRRLDAATRDLEFDADRLADSAHLLSQYRHLAGRVAGRVLDDASQALDRRARAERSRSGTEDVPVRDVLRGLSRVENR